MSGRDSKQWQWRKKKPTTPQRVICAMKKSQGRQRGRLSWTEWKGRRLLSPSHGSMETQNRRWLVESTQFLEKQRNSWDLNPTLSTYDTSHQSSCCRVNNVLQIQVCETLTSPRTCEEVIKGTRCNSGIRAFVRKDQSQWDGSTGKGACC